MRKHFIVIAIFIFIAGFALNIQAQQQKPSPKMMAANELYKQQKWQEAAQAFGDVLKDEPNNGRAWYLLGSTLHVLGKYEQAIDAFQKNYAIAQNPNSLYNIACAYSLLKQTDKAFEWMEKALSGGAAIFVNLDTDKDLDNIRADARYKKMTELADRQKRPCIYSAEARQFDFWVGDWDVYNTAGQKAGTNTIQLFSDGCGLMENWTSTVAGDGKSINYYDASTQKWYQNWIGSGGGALRYSGNFKDGVMRFEGETVSGGKKTLQKLTFTKIDENTVRQLFEASTDDGKTWAVTTDLKYVKRK
ncbi:MAG: tetratricopeptide repeat protein [Pyrinomonadaceae bacterium]